MVSGLDIQGFLQNVKATKPPYECPYNECEKVFKTFKGIHAHVTAHSKEGGEENEAEDDPLTYADAQKIVEFQFDGKPVHISMYEPLALLSKDEFERKFPNLAKEPCEASEAPKALSFKVNGGKVSAKKGHKGTPKSSKNGFTDDPPPTDVPPDSEEKKTVKLPEPQFSVLEDYDIPDAPDRLKNYFRYIEKSAEELDDEVEYDMDEEDCAWLEMMNSKRKFDGLAPLSISDFELLMDRLEKESYFQVQSTGKHHGPPIDEDAVCCICNDGECENTNVILFCDMCNLAVHQECYGIPYIPEGQWLCRRCLQSPSRSVDCALCPNKGGAFKQTDDNRWAHVVCALWIPEVMFANLVFLEPIDSIQNIPAPRWRLTCYICKQRGAGACIQCHRPNCYTAFHVTCAQQAGLHMKMDTVREAQSSGINVSVRKEAFCDAHTPLDSECKYMEDLGEGADPRKVEARAAFRKRIRFARKILEEKRTAPRIVSVPTIPPEKVRVIASLIAAQGRNSFLLRLISYWTLKRQSRNGVPLIRRLQMTHPSKRNEEKGDGRNKKDEIMEELRYWQRLRQDLEKARLLCELVRKREKTKKEWLRLKEREFELRLAPQFYYMRRLLDTLQDKDNEDIFGDPVDPREVPDYAEVIKHPMDYSTMRKKLDNHEYRDLGDFSRDFNLIMDNCMQYNDDNTPYFRTAKKLKEDGAVLIKQARRELEGPGSERKRESSLDTPSGSPRNFDHELMEEVDIVLGKGDGSDPTERISQLMDAQDKAQSIKQGMARNKRLKLLRVEISKVRRKLSTIEDREIVSTSRSNTPPVRGKKAPKEEISKVLKTVPKIEPSGRKEVKAVAPVQRRQTQEKKKKESDDSSSSSSDSSSEESFSSSSSSSSLSDIEPPKLSPMVPPKPASAPKKTKQTKIDAFLTRKPPKPAPPDSSSEDEPPPVKERKDQRNGVDERQKPASKSAGKAPVSRRPLERLSDSSTDSEVDSIIPSKARKPSPSENGGAKGRVIPKVIKKQKGEVEGQKVVSKVDYATPVKTGSNPGSVNNSPAGVNRRTAVLFNKKAVVAIKPPDFGRSQVSAKPGPKKKNECPVSERPVSEPPPSDSDSDTPVRSMFDPDLLRGEGELDSLAKERESFKIYRSSSSDSESGSESSEESDSESDSEDSSESDNERSSSLIPLEPLDLVWAKCRGYPWYPALIINPKMPRTGYYHNGVPIPVPPQDVLDLASTHTEPKFLVLFFDSKRTWQWLPRSKLELLGADPNNDKTKLVDSKKPTDRKAVKKAYEEAITHRSRVTGETPGLSGDSDGTE